MLGKEEENDEERLSPVVIRRFVAEARAVISQVAELAIDGANIVVRAIRDEAFHVFQLTKHIFVEFFLLKHLLCDLALVAEPPDLNLELLVVLAGQISFCLKLVHLLLHLMIDGRLNTDHFLE